MKTSQSFIGHFLQVWTEYIGYKKDSLTKTLEDVDNEIPTQISDISRILIERLRIPGSKYFGIDTAEVCHSNHTFKRNIKLILSSDYHRTRF